MCARAAASELLEASLSGPDGEVMRAAAWRLQVGELELPEEPGARPAGPEQGVEKDFFDTGQEVGYHTAMEYRFLSGAFLEPGPAVVWMRARVPWWRERSPPRCSACW